MVKFKFYRGKINKININQRSFFDNKKIYINLTLRKIYIK